MPRRAAAQIRPVEPDPVHRSRLVQQVINKVMLDGKKSTAERIVYDALAIIAERTGKEPVEALENSIKTLTPVLEVRSRRVGGATYQVPVEVPARRARTLAVRWLVEFARQRREKTMAQRLANELMDAHVPAGRRVQAQGRHLPHGAGQQGLRALPLVAGASRPGGAAAARRLRHPRVAKVSRRAGGDPSSASDACDAVPDIAVDVALRLAHAAAPDVAQASRTGAAAPAAASPRATQSARAPTTRAPSGAPAPAARRPTAHSSAPPASSSQNPTRGPAAASEYSRPDLARCRRGAARRTRAPTSSAADAAHQRPPTIAGRAPRATAPTSITSAKPGDHEQRGAVAVPAAQLGVEAREPRGRPDGDPDDRRERRERRARRPRPAPAASSPARTPSRTPDCTPGRRHPAAIVSTRPSLAHRS